MRQVDVRQFGGDMTEYGSQMTEPVRSVSPVQQPANDHEQIILIDTELLIAEVKKRPVLYQVVKTEKLAKKTAWFGVCRSLFRHHWKNFSIKQKFEKVREVTRHWQKLRNSFLNNSWQNENYNTNMSFLLPLVSRMEPEDLSAKKHKKPKVSVPKAETPKYDPDDECLYFGLTLVSHLRRLSANQRLTCYRTIYQVIQNLEEESEPKNISVMQDQLRYPEDAGSSNLLEHMSYTVPEPVLAEEQVIQDDPSLSSVDATLARPRNDHGDIEYPTTDPEDLDEI